MTKKEVRELANKFIMELKYLNEEQIKEFVRELMLDNNTNTNKFINIIYYWTGSNNR